MISTFTREECKQVIQECRERLRELTTLNPVVYLIKKTSERYGVRYRTHASGLGWRQTLALDVYDSNLWASSTLEWAQDVIEAYNKEPKYAREGSVFEIVEFPKEEFRKLPCYPAFEKYKVFG